MFVLVLSQHHQVPAKNAKPGHQMKPSRKRKHFTKVVTECGCTLSAHPNILSQPGTRRHYHSITRCFCSKMNNDSVAKLAFQNSMKQWLNT